MNSTEESMEYLVKDEGADRGKVLAIRSEDYDADKYSEWLVFDCPDRAQARAEAIIRNRRQKLNEERDALMRVECENTAELCTWPLWGDEEEW